MMMRRHEVEGWIAVPLREATEAEFLKFKHDPIWRLATVFIIDRTDGTMYNID
jgi:hypothetical protein